MTGITTLKSLVGISHAVGQLVALTLFWQHLRDILLPPIAPRTIYEPLLVPVGRTRR